jgi:hypothetical protein
VTGLRAQPASTHADDDPGMAERQRDEDLDREPDDEPAVPGESPAPPPSDDERASASSAAAAQRRHGGRDESA